MKQGIFVAELSFSLRWAARRGVDHPSCTGGPSSICVSACILAIYLRQMVARACGERPTPLFLGQELGCGGRENERSRPREGP